MSEARIAIVGLGLMGGSLAMACKQRSVCRQIVGVARRPETVDQALELDAVHQATTDLGQAVGDADIIVLSTPARTIIRQIRQLASMQLPPCLVLDLGSTKGQVAETMRLLPPHVEAVGTHPMCGKETAGIESADPDLFQAAPWILTPLPGSNPRAMNLARDLAKAVGAKPLVMDPERHDHLVAATSHLPYALAASLVMAAADVGDQDDQVWTLAASGFRDTSRVAASNVTMMVDILMTNREAVVEALSTTAGRLERLAQVIANGDDETLRALLTPVQKRRASMFSESSSLDN